MGLKDWANRLVICLWHNGYHGNNGGLKQKDQHDLQSLNFAWISNCVPSSSLKMSYYTQNDHLITILSKQIVYLTLGKRIEGSLWKSSHFLRHAFFCKRDGQFYFKDMEKGMLSIYRTIPKCWVFLEQSLPLKPLQRVALMGLWVIFMDACNTNVLLIPSGFM